MVEERPTPAGARLRILLLAVVAAIVCALSLRFHFPRYFDPFAVSHLDNFVYAGMQYEGYGAFVRYLVSYPRPFGNVLLHHAGSLGLEWQFAPVFAAYVLNVALLPRYLERLTGRPIALPSFILFAALIYANPEFYWGIKLDPLAVYSLAFLLLAVHAWQSYLETSRRGYLLLATILLLLGIQTKECYFVVIGLFWIAQLHLFPGHRKAASAMLLTSVVFMAFALYRALTWTQVGGAAYEQTLQPAAIIQGFLILARLLFFPGLAVATIAIAVAGWWRDRPVFWITVSCVVFAAASLLPNAAFPNHLHNHYAALGILFACAPVLPVDRLVPHRPAWHVAIVALGLATYGVVAAEQRPNIQGAAGWNRDQEQFARHLVRTLRQMKSETRPGESVLVAGLMTPYNPFFAPAFIQGEMCGACKWTVITGSPKAPSQTGNVELIRPSDPKILGKYDRVFVIAQDGRLAAAYRGNQVLIMQPRTDGSSATRFFATPNPARALDNGLTRVTLNWAIPEGRHAEVRVGAPSGAILAADTRSGSAETGEWVQDGMLFFLQDASQSNSTSPQHTMAIVIVSVDNPSASPQR